MKIINFVSLNSLLLMLSLSVFAQEDSLKDKFEKLFSHWQKAPFLPGEPFSSTLKPNQVLLDKIIEMGPSVIPYLVEKLKQNDNDGAALAPVSSITKIKIDSDFNKNKGVCTFKDYPDFSYVPRYLRKRGEPVKNIWVYWWEDGRKRTPELFSKKYGEWKVAVLEEKKEDEIKAKYKAIQDLGIVALPQILEKIKGGDKELIPMFSELVDGKVAKTASANTCQEWWEKNKSFYDAVLNY